MLTFSSCNMLAVFPQFISLILLIYLLRLCWVFIAVQAFFWFEEWSYSGCSAQASHCSGVSLRSAGSMALRLQQLWPVSSVIMACGFSSCSSRTLGCRLSSCGTRTYLLHSEWDLPQSGLEPVSSALAGELFATQSRQEGPSLVYLIMIFWVYKNFKISQLHLLISSFMAFAFRCYAQKSISTPNLCSMSSVYFQNFDGFFFFLHLNL